MDELRIIIADDESIIRMDLREMLQEVGHTVVAEAQNGEELVAAVQTFAPDLVITDIKMPVLDGLSAIKLFNAEYTVPVILLTAFSQVEFIQEAAQIGVLAYLSKPIREEQLVPAIEIAMSRFGNIRDLEQEIQKLQETLELRKLVERAKGILMTVHNYSEEAAYRKMQQYAMNERSSLQEVARAVVRSYEQRQKGRKHE